MEELATVHQLVHQKNQFIPRIISDCKLTKCNMYTSSLMNNKNKMNGMFENKTGELVLVVSTRTDQ